ncbi:MAG: flagellar basal body P-ring protein FlgI [Buchnera aphidicola (Chaetogeoica yunlongensis)]
MLKKYILISLLCLFSTPVLAYKIRDLITIQGIRNYPLIGYGLVIGLDGTGDQTNQIPYTTNSIKNMLSKLGTNIPNDKNTQFKNIASVMVTANFPNFIHIGQQIDVTVSSIGNAKSLKGGTLLVTPLKGTDNKVYAIAQGNILINTKTYFDKNFEKQYSLDNHFNNGKIINGAIIEKEIANFNFGNNKTLNLQLNKEDFNVAKKISNKINNLYPNSSIALNSKTIQIQLPNDIDEQVTVLANIQNMNIHTPIQDSKIIINTRTGDIVTNQIIKINTCVINHKNISVIVNNNKSTNNKIILKMIPKIENNEYIYKSKTYKSYDTHENKNIQKYIKIINQNINLNDIINTLYSIGITTSELISILQSMSNAGCFHAKLEII